MNILVNFATRSRPGRFIRVMDRLVKYTAQRDKLTVLVKCDIDDHKMSSKLLNPYLAHYSKRGISARATWAPRSSKIGAINRDIQTIKGWDVLVNISDDMLPALQNWDNVLRTAVQSVWADSTDFFAHFSDGRVFEQLCTLSIIGNAYYQRDQYVYHPIYKSFSCDAEAMYVAQMRAKHAYFPQVLFRHDHPAYTRESNDLLYRENSRHSDYDVKVYFERLNNYFDIPAAERTCVPFEQFMNINAAKK